MASKSKGLIAINPVVKLKRKEEIFHE